MATESYKPASEQSGGQSGEPAGERLQGTVYAYEWLLSIVTDPRLTTLRPRARYRDLPDCMKLSAPE
jgi:hypothetical protein